MSLIRSSIGRRTSDGTAAAAALEIIAGSRGAIVRDITVSLAAATASIYGLGRPAAKGQTPTSPVTSLVEGSIDPSNVALQTAIAWAVGPTVPANFFRRIGFPATIGSTIVWTFGQGLFIPSGTTVVLWNIGTNGVADVTITADEPGI
jgi:hypothetical protein